MKNINVHVLDSLIAIYFGQDYDLFGSGESVDTQIDVWIADTPSATRHGLIGDIDQFIQESDNLEDDFESRYGNEFSAQLWDTTPANFLSLLRQKVIDSLSCRECLTPGDAYSVPIRFSLFREKPRERLDEHQNV